VTSLLSLAEVTRAASRRSPDDALRASALLAQIVLLALDRAVMVAAGGLPPPVLRTLDAIHLASALQLGPELRWFITYDARLAAAARAHGLPVISPGSTAV